MDTKSWIESLENRRLTYIFLAQGFREAVSVEMLQAFRDAPPAFEGPLGVFFSGLANCDLERVRLDLASEYAALFLAMSAQPVPPYESVYVSDEKLLMQSARDHVVALYREEGLVRADSINVPEDHIAIEFEFAGLLCQQALEELRAGNAEKACLFMDKQKLFVSCHLANWIRDFTDDVLRAASTDFYRGLAQTAQTFILLDNQLLQDAWWSD